MLFSRIIAAGLIIVSATLPASAVTTRNLLDAPLTAAAARMKVKDFNGARTAALKSNEAGARAFLIGMADIKLENWEEAAAQLAAAAESYPLLADYALYNQALALSKLERYDQALNPLYRLLQQYPDSRLVRAAMILYGDSIASRGYPKEALETYTLFIERYPSGSDSISALYGSALCKEKLGDSKAAASIFRSLWLKYPTSPYAEKAAGQLELMAQAGVTVAPYTPAELYKRAVTLYDLGRSRDAADALAKLPLDGQSDDFAFRVRLKLGQAQLKARHYDDAQATFRAIVNRGAANGNLAEARYWLGKALDKAGKTDEAYQVFMKLAEVPRSTTVADDALLEAAYLKRFQKKWGEAQQLFKRYLDTYPAQRTPAVIWETAWTSYLSRDYKAAAGFFRQLAERDETREKALYWLGKSLTATGDGKGAESAYSTLASEYPFGYYALICNRMCPISAFPQPPRNLADSLAMPAGYEREKALISFGLFDEAGRELSAKKGKNTLVLARLYLEMGNYNGAYHLISRERPKRSLSESGQMWGLFYPLAYLDEVTHQASANSIPDTLVWAVMRTESNYFPGALSPVGAVGLMQIMPATAERISRGDGSRLTRPDLNIRLGAKHLRSLLASYNGNMTLAIAAYNAGSGNVNRWQKSLGDLPQDEFVESIPFRETREYVKKVATAMEIYKRLYRLQPVPAKGSAPQTGIKEEPQGSAPPAPPASAEPSEPAPQQPAAGQ
ncbi:transglycosylase SLT domain-containing protein [Geomonas sp. Red32]|uniref:lytic transglycosylase domain-containing protein n=1 Tax=Geomonas sp. Red32 TaxID=2912856 RepID=UPI00202D0734|nr:tetratricopeptide repeat protein [Geomonas sp. Red32]MCM0083457.1 transglycosylase SLT domain-containing protein [Geomonas sp. Red32]